jgi:hypothetical protein
MLEEIENTKNYIENMLNYELSLSNLDDVKSFLSSEFYESVYDNLLDFTSGIIITEQIIVWGNRDDTVIYKEMFNTDTLFDVYTDEKGNNIYTATRVIEGDCCNYIMIDNLTDKVKINYDILNNKEEVK